MAKHSQFSGKLAKEKQATFEKYAHKLENAKKEVSAGCCHKDESGTFALISIEKKDKFGRKMCKCKYCGQEISMTARTVDEIHDIFGDTLNFIDQLKIYTNPQNEEVMELCKRTTMQLRAIEKYLCVRVENGVNTKRAQEKAQPRVIWGKK